MEYSGLENFGNHEDFDRLTIDYKVARDKIAQFQTPDEIANFMRDEGATGYRELSDQCVLAQWMQDITGESIQVSMLNMWTEEDIENSIDNTPAMTTFIKKFDNGDYPDLIIGW